MKAIKRVISILIVVLTMIAVMAPLDAFAAIRKFDSSGSGTNIQHPRGYYVVLEDGSKHWLASKFVLPKGDKNQSATYTGSDSGLSYVDASKATQIRALVSNGIQATANCADFVMGFYKKSTSDSLSSLSIGSLSADGTSISTPDGGANKWCIKFTSLTLETGTYYEFAYKCGLYANNGSTCVISKDEDGYLAFDNTGAHTFISDSETAWYNSHKNNEFYYPNFTKSGEDSYKINYIPFRYHIQTYADVSAWDTEAKKVKKVIASTGNADLKAMYDQYNKQVSEVIKYELQTDADKNIAKLINSIEAEMNKKPTDLTEYKSVLNEAKTLYNNVKNKVGTSVGQYGSKQVNNLLSTINSAEKHVGDKTSQSDVDAYTLKLKQAIASVKASKVTEKEVVFYDSSTGITVTAKSGSLPKGVKLYVAQVADNDTLYNNVKEKATTKPDKIVAYVIKFYANNKEVTLKSSVKIQIPVKSSMTASKTSVALLSKDGTQTAVSSTLAKGVQVFRTSKMGYFGILEFSSGIGGTELDNTDSILVADDNLDGNQINEIDQREVQGESINDREMQDANRNSLVVGGIDLSKLSNDIGADTLRFIGIGIAAFGILCGVVEFVRSKREEDLFV